MVPFSFHQWCVYGRYRTCVLFHKNSFIENSRYLLYSTILCRVISYTIYMIFCFRCCRLEIDDEAYAYIIFYCNGVVYYYLAYTNHHREFVTFNNISRTYVTGLLTPRKNHAAIFVFFTSTVWRHNKTKNLSYFHSLFIESAKIFAIHLLITHL